MSFSITLLIPISLLLLVFISLYIKNSSRVIKIISSNWCKIPKVKMRYSNFTYLFGICFLFISLLDIRGEPTFSEGGKSTAYTVILLDTSLSMLAEDLQPNRINSAIVHLKHFIKKAQGHMFELHVFSDNHKRVLAFTDDKNLILTRLEALKSIGAIGGGSDIGTSIKAAASSFKTNDIKNGNILLISDADFDQLESLKNVPKNDNINLALLKTSRTESGVKIPLRTPDGRLKFNKRSNGQEVLTKPNPEFLNAIKKVYTNSIQYDVSGYSFNSQNILEFFESSKLDDMETLKYLSRPVYSPWIMLIFFLCIILFYTLRIGSNFLSVFFLIVLLSSSRVSAIEVEKIKNGEAKINEIVNFAYKEVQEKRIDNGIYLLEENLESISKENINEYFNLGGLYLQKGQLKKGLDIYQQVSDYIQGKNEFIDLEKKIRENILFALNQQGSGQGKGDQSESNKSQKGEQDSENQNDGENQDNQKQKQPKNQQGNTDGIIQQILNDDKKSHEKFLKTELKKGQVRSGGNDW